MVEEVYYRDHANRGRWAVALGAYRLMTLELRPTYLTRAQLGAELQVSGRTIQRWEREGMPTEVWGVRLRRYRVDLVRRWLEQRKGRLHG